MEEGEGAGTERDGEYGPDADEGSQPAELSDALRLAYDYLDRRDHTVAEVRSYLGRKRVRPSDIEGTIAALYAQSLLDDELFSRRLAEDKREIEGWGSERIEKALIKRGVVPETARRAASRSPLTELDAARRLLAERYPFTLDDERMKSRALGFLVRRGYSLDIAHEAVGDHQHQHRMEA